MSLYCQCRCADTFLVPLAPGSACADCTKQFCADQAACTSELRLVETQCIDRRSAKDLVVVVLYLVAVACALALAVRARARARR